MNETPLTPDQIEELIRTVSTPTYNRADETKKEIAKKTIRKNLLSLTNARDYTTHLTGLINHLNTRLTDAEMARDRYQVFVGSWRSTATEQAQALAVAETQIEKLTARLDRIHQS